jgi:hypothetical protein
MSAFSKYGFGFRTRRAFTEILTTKCKMLAMTTNLLDHVQAVRIAYEAANSRDSFVGRWRITPYHPDGVVKNGKPYSGIRR